MNHSTPYSYRQIYNVAYPIFITLLVQNLIQVTDTAFLGRVGEVELGASAIAGIFYIVIFTLAFGFSNGSQIIIGRRNGEQNYKQIGEIVVVGTLFLLLIALCMFLFVRTFSRPALSAVLSSTAVLEASVTYLNHRVWGIFFACINVMFRAFYTGTTKTRILSINAGIMAGVNVVFDYALIFGHFGFPVMGIAGAAIASVIAEATSVLFFFSYTLLTIDLKKYGFTFIRPGARAVVKNILNVSLSLMLQYMISLGTWLIFFLFIEKMGERSLAASNVVRSIYILFAIPVFALSTTTNTLVSNTIGTGNINGVKPLIWKIVRAALCLALFFVPVILLFPDLTLSVYTSDPNLISAARPSMIVVALTLPVMAFGNLFFSSVSGTGNTRTALLIEMGVMCFYLTYVYLLVNVAKASLAICWTSEIVYAGGIFIFSYFYIKSGKWKDRRI
ncbi:MAG: MATE family efflux transporter [Prevotellaceae bacterium]|nr:MATE family efflux transporter [Prevotellaceae bacterium]